MEVSVFAALTFTVLGIVPPVMGFSAFTFVACILAFLFLSRD